MKRAFVHENVTSSDFVPSVIRMSVCESNTGAAGLVENVSSLTIEQDTAAMVAAVAQNMFFNNLIIQKLIYCFS